MQVEVTPSSSQKEKTAAFHSQLTKYRGRKVELIPQERKNLMIGALSLAEKFCVSIEHLVGIKRVCLPVEFIQALRDVDHLLREAEGQESEEDVEGLKNEYQKQIAQQVGEVIAARKQLWQSLGVASEIEYNEKSRLLERYCEVAEATYLNTPDHVERRKTIDEFLLMAYQKKLNPTDSDIISRYWDYVTGKFQGKEARSRLKERMHQLFVETIAQKVLIIPSVIENTLKSNARIPRGHYIVTYLQAQVDKIVEDLQKERAYTLDPHEQLTLDYLLLMGRPRMHVAVQKVLREVLFFQIKKLKESMPELILSLKRSHENELQHYQNYLRDNQVALKVAQKKKIECDPNEAGQLYYAQLEINILTQAVADAEQNVQDMQVKTDKDFSAQASSQMKALVEELQSHIPIKSEFEQLMSHLEKLESKEEVSLDDLKISLTNDPVDYFVQKFDRLDQERLELFKPKVKVEEID